MYIIFGCLLLIVLICFPLFYLRKKRACKKVCAMSFQEKCDTLETLISPFGYCYNASQDVFSTRVDAPQRAFGYTAAFDRYASRFGMVFDCAPVYFDHGGRTWLIELWKGQYGINLGCEVGIYKADSLVPSIRLGTTLFHSVDDREMLPMTVYLYRHDDRIAHLCKRHWWLTIFRMGDFCQPGELSMQACIAFPNVEMRDAFTNALAGQTNLSCKVCGLHVWVLFAACTSCRLPFLRRLFCRFIQWKNRLACRLFLRVTKPFCSGMDRLLCLYYLLPPLFRCIFKDKKRRKCHRKCQRKCRKGCCGNCR